MKKKDDKGKNDEEGNDEGGNDEGRNKETVCKKKGWKIEVWIRTSGSISEARSKAISGASRIIDIEVHYPTYCTPSCSPYQISRKISVY